MTILKSKNKEKESEVIRHVGVTIPNMLNNYLVLFILAKGMTKTHIIRNLLKDWQENEKVYNSESKLIDQVSNRLKIEWKVLNQKKEGQDFTWFQEESKKELAKLKLDKNIIAKIIQKLAE